MKKGLKELSLHSSPKIESMTGGKDLSKECSKLEGQQEWKKLKKIIPRGYLNN